LFFKAILKSEQLPDIRSIFETSGRSDIPELILRLENETRVNGSDQNVIKKVLGTYLWSKNNKYV
jgi:hypothetical protein